MIMRALGDGAESWRKLPLEESRNDGQQRMAGSNSCCTMHKFAECLHTTEDWQETAASLVPAASQVWAPPPTTNEAADDLVSESSPFLSLLTSLSAGESRWALGSRPPLVAGVSPLATAHQGTERSTASTMRQAQHHRFSR